jgi:hypothetical protein
MMRPVKVVTLAAIFGLCSGAVLAQSSSTDSMSSGHSSSMSTSHSSDSMSSGHSPGSMSNGHSSDSKPTQSH